MGRTSDSESDHSKKIKKRQRRSRSRTRSSSSSRSSGQSRSSSHHRSKHHLKRSSRSRSRSHSRKFDSQRKHYRSSSKEKGSKSRSRSDTSQKYSSSSKSSMSKWSSSKNKDNKDSKGEKEEKSSKKTSTESSSKASLSVFSSLQEKSAAEILKQKLQLALKAAADADALLREQGVLTGKSTKDRDNFEELNKGQVTSSSIKEQIERAKAVEEINSSEFHQQAFISGKTNPKQTEEGKIAWENHDAAIFGTDQELKSALNATVEAQSEAINIDKDAIAHENLFLDPAIREERWIKKLMYMRQRKLNGEAML